MRFCNMLHHSDNVVTVSYIYHQSSSIHLAQNLLRWAITGLTTHLLQLYYGVVHTLSRWSICDQEQCLHQEVVAHIWERFASQSQTSLTVTTQINTLPTLPDVALLSRAKQSTGTEYPGPQLPSHLSSSVADSSLIVQYLASRSVTPSFGPKMVGNTLVAITVFTI